MPIPARVEYLPGRLALDAGFRVALAGFRDARLERAVRRMLDRLARRTGLPLVRAPLDSSVAAPLSIETGGPGQRVPSLAEDESYTLRVATDGARLEAPTVVGVVRGLETFLQLVEEEGGRFSLPGVEISDRPRFPWRGLLIDVGRHFQPVAVIQRQLDGMAAVKLNVFHWHLSEDQGFRVESKRYPRLQRLGSGARFYTQAQIRAIVAYASDRGIRVVPEFDMPGHSTSWFAGFPRLASAPGRYRLQPRFGVFRPVFDPSRAEVYAFLDGFVGEMVQLFPDAYWHVGGDEVLPTDWRANPRIRRFMGEHQLPDAPALQAYFIGRVGELLARHGKGMVGWDEILRPDLRGDAVIQAWRGAESLRRAVEGGHPAILSAGYYLDHLRPAELHYAVDPLAAAAAPDSTGAPSVLGGEACMWGEEITPETIDSRIWPRVAAVAERLWSPAAVTDVDDMYRRLELTSRRLAELGLGHERHTEQMLRRYAPVGDLPALRDLLELVAPVYSWERARIQRPTTRTALTGLVDAARPDRWRARRGLAALVAGFLADPRYQEGRDSLVRVFTQWDSVAQAVLRLDHRHRLAREAQPAAAALGTLAELGRGALVRLPGLAPPDSTTRARVLAALDRVGRPQGLVRLEVAAPLVPLVHAAYSP